MKVDLKNPNPGKWFFFDDKNQKDGRICLRVCPQAKVAAIYRSASTTIIKETPGGRPYEVSEQDQEKANALLWDYVIVDWEGVEDVKPIKCTTEAKAVLMGGHPQFASFVTEKLELLKRLGLKHQKDLEKN